jgi:hypothetical protein
MAKIKVFLVDDHQMMIDGLLSLLKSEEDIVICGTALNGQAALDALPTALPDIVLTDISMPGMDGIALTKAIKSQFPNIKIIALSMFNDSHHISDMLEAGISGYILKNTGNQEMMEALRRVASGATYYSDEVAAEMMRALTDRSHKKQETEAVHLTEREREIIILIAKEYSNAKIASELFISERTVETHRKNIYRKTNTSNIVGLLKFAMEHGLTN